MRISILLVLLFYCSIIFADEHISKIDSLKIELNNSNSDEESIEVLSTLSLMLIDSEIPDSSIIYLVKMIEVAQNLSDLKNESLAYRLLSESYMRKYIFEKTEYYAKKALAIDENTKYIRGYLLDLNQLGRVYHHFQKYQKAIDIYKKGLTITIDSTNFEIISAIYGNIGNSYKRQYKYEKAIESYLIQIDVADKFGDFQQKSKANYNLGNHFMDLEQYEKAERFFLSALKDSSKFKLRIYEIMNHHSLAINYSRWGKYEKAISENEIVLDYYRSIGNKLYEFDVLNNIAVVYSRMGNQLIALSYAKQAFSVAEELGNKLAIDGAKSTLVNIYLDLEDYDKAEFILREIAPDTVDSKIIRRESKADLLENFYLVYKGKKRYKEALIYLERFKILYDSIHREQRDNKEAELVAKYNNERAEKELIKKDSELKIAKNQKYLSSIYNYFISLITLFLFVLLVFSFWRNRKNKLKQQRLIAEIETLRKEVFALDEGENITVEKEMQFHQFLMKKYRIERIDLIYTWESIAKGESLLYYAELVNKSKDTIKSWRKELYKRLKTYYRVELVRYSSNQAIAEYYKALIAFKCK